MASYKFSDMFKISNSNLKSNLTSTSIQWRLSSIFSSVKQCWKPKLLTKCFFSHLFDRKQDSPLMTHWLGGEFFKVNEIFRLTAPLDRNMNEEKVMSILLVDFSLSHLVNWGRDIWPLNTVFTILYLFINPHWMGTLEP